MRKVNKINWDDIPLGQMTDREISEKYNIPFYLVGQARNKLDIPPHRGHRKTRFNWEKYKELPLGQVPDSVIAKKLCCTRQRVEQIRKRLGIPSYTKSKAKEYEKAIDDLDLAGKMPDSKIAKLSEIPITHIKNYRKKKNIENGYRHELDHRWDDTDWSMTNGKIAQIKNLCPEVVGRARKRLKKPAPSFIPGEHKYINWDAQPIGKMPDSLIARKLGVSRNAVLCARKTRGIPPFKKSRK